MTPYYADAAVTIYHGDCREVVPHVTADVLITDPPYGVEFRGKHSKWSQPTGGYIGDDDADIGPAVVSLTLPLVQRAAVFSGIRQMFSYPKPVDVGSVFNDSGAGFGPWGYVCFHPVLFYGKATTNKRPASLRSYELANGMGHPAAKPMGWMRWAVNLASEPGETILDPFMGSGTTLRAAKDLGRRAIGIEREERYCEIAVQRLGQEVLDLWAG